MREFIFAVFTFQRKMRKVALSFRISQKRMYFFQGHPKMQEKRSERRGGIDVGDSDVKAQGDFVGGDKITSNTTIINPPPEKRSTSHLWRYIVAFIGAAGLVLAALVPNLLNGRPVVTPTAPPTLSTMEIVGRVSALDSGENISNAIVILDYQDIPKSVYTDVNGVFSLRVKTPSSPVSVRIRVQANGYRNYERFFNLPDDAPLDIRLVSNPPTQVKATNTNATVAQTVQPITVEPPVPETPSAEIRQLLLDSSQRERSLHLNPETGLMRFADRFKLGGPQSDEFEFQVNSQVYVGQVFTNAIAYVKKGSWSELEYKSLPLAKYGIDDSIATTLDRVIADQYVLGIDESSKFSQLAKEWDLGFALTREFSLASSSKRYVVQVFQRGIVYREASSFDHIGLIQL